MNKTLVYLIGGTNVGILSSYEEVKQCVESDGFLESHSGMHPDCRCMLRGRDVSHFEEYPDSPQHT